MYQVGQRVVYAVHGVCTVAEIETKSVDRKKISYYVLEPIDQSGARYYVPTENPAALKKLSPLLTREELENMLAECSVTAGSWIADENQRKVRYKELIVSGDRRALVMMVHTLHEHKKRQESEGKKFHLCDENFLKDAEKLLTSEISLVLELSRDETAAYLRNMFENNRKA